MQRILAIIRKDWIIRFSNPTEWLFFLVLPLVFTFVIGGGFAGDAETADQRVRLLVVNQAQNALADELLAILNKSSSVRVDLQPATLAEQALANGQAVALLTIPSGFEQQAMLDGSATLDLQLKPNDLNALAAERAVMSASEQLGRAASAVRAGIAARAEIMPFENAATQAAAEVAAYQLAQAQLAAATPLLKVTLPENIDQETYDQASQASAGQLITWVFTPLVGLSGYVAYERSRGTLRRLVVSPLRKPVYLAGMLSGDLILALIQMLLLVSFGTLVMGLPWGQAPLALAAVMVSFALAGAAFGSMLGTFIKTEQQSFGLTMMLGMTMAMLGGCWYPLEIFPEAVRNAVQILPTTWAMQGMLDIVLRGQGLSGVLTEAGVLLGFAALFFGVGVVRFRYV